MDINRFAVLLRAQRLTLFGSRDLAVLLPAQDRRLSAVQLHQWTRKGWVRRLKRGLYELAYPEAVAVADLFVANRLYDPSYVSLETALSHYQLIPETAAQVTSVTTKPTRRFRNAHGLFTYFTIRPAAFAGIRLITLQGAAVRIAEPEKAVVDRLYAGLRRGEALDLPHGRWDRRALRRLKRDKLRAYAGLFGAASARLEARVDALVR